MLFRSEIASRFENLIAENEDFKDEIKEEINVLKNEIKSSINTNLNLIPVSGTTKIIKQFSPLF